MASTKLEVTKQKLECASLSQPLLLPNEYCLAEGKADFELSCDQIDGQRSSHQNVYAKLECKVYITNERVGGQHILANM